MNIGCVILAAGQGRRFGENKLLHMLGDRSVLARTLDNIPQERFAQMAVVASSEGVERLCKERGVACICYAGGPQSQSIRLGVQAMRGMDGCLFAMGDQPFCALATIEKMVYDFISHPDCVVRMAYGQTQCSPVIFPKRYFASLEMLTGEQGGMAAIRALSPHIRLVQAMGEEELWDLDTREDLHCMEQLIGKKER